MALMLVYAVQLTGFFSWVMRQSAELQNAVRIIDHRSAVFFFSPKIYSLMENIYERTGRGKLFDS